MILDVLNSSSSMKFDDIRISRFRWFWRLVGVVVRIADSQLSVAGSNPGHDNARLFLR